ncbi:MAG: autotransporter outer membrane beta-barrel domain-containing protein [Pseudomonadota bacterium]
MQNDNEPDDDTLAWVFGVDDVDGETYYWLVKTDGEVFYNQQGEAFEVDTLDYATNTGEVTYTDQSISYDFTPGLTEDDWDAAFSDSATGGSANEPVDNDSPTQVQLILTGDDGGDGADGALFVPAGAGGDGADGPDVTQTLSSDIDARTTENIGWEIGSVGGNGGDGGNEYLSWNDAQDGGDGGAGGTVVATQDASSTILTAGDEDGDVGNDGIYAFSKSGAAGDGGDGFVTPGGGTGGHTSNGGDVTVNQNGTIITTGTNGDGVYALSFSNNGGDGGDQWGAVGVAGEAGFGGSGGDVTVNATGTISTEGDYSNAIFAQSVGGSGGSAGSSGDLLLSLSDDNADNGGNGGDVAVTNSGTLGTTGDYSTGILAQSIGGAGGSGGTDVGAVVLNLGGVGSKGGEGGTVTVTNEAEGSISTTGVQSDGIFAQSVGGSGNTGVTSVGIISLGGSSSGSAGNDSGPVTVSNFGTISTEGDTSRGLVAQSVAGGGGDGGNSVGLIVAIGGSGAAAGDADTVTVTNDGSIETDGNDAPAILAQSVGMGGGNGGNSVSVSVFESVAIGGSASGGGDGGEVIVNLTDEDETEASTIRTAGDRSPGVSAQSVGGGGGNGGGAVSVSAGFAVDAAVSVGGSGAGAGDGGEVSLDGSGDVSVVTQGDDSDGLFLQSVGGGGGNGGYAISVGIAAGPASGSIGVAVGGKGGGGGAGDTVQVGTVDDDTGELESSGFTGTVLTFGDRSNGMTLQSVGMGGGNGGLAVAVTGGASPLISGSISVGVGGSGGSGGAGGDVLAYTDPTIQTRGDNSTGLLVQSVGGGGGNGGGSVAAGIDISSASAGGINVGVGGSGGSAAAGGTVDLIADGDRIRTFGNYSPGITVQSIGGGGGNGGFSVGAGVDLGGAGALSVDVAVGGTGGGGGDGGEVSLSTSSVIRTSGTDSTGVLAQSVGMGGGNGGFSVAAGEATGGGGAGTVSVGVGGNGASGGDGSAVTANVENTVITAGDRSTGVLVQSVGGGGGNGGFDVSGAVSVGGTGSGSVSVGLGGKAGGGGDGAKVEGTVAGAISTSGASAPGFVVQSIGGGGGNGGFNVSPSLSFAGEGSGAVSVGLGGVGGDGGDGGRVIATSSNQIVTTGDQSGGIVAQSVGYGGGNGAFNVSASLTGSGTASGAIGVGIGGSGGSAGDGGKVVLNVTDDRESFEIGSISHLTDSSDFTIFTSGNRSSAVIAQSVGYGGGNGGFNVTVSGAAAGEGAGSVGVGIGGRGAGGGDGGEVESDVTANIYTDGDESIGLLVQSEGGGGGNGGFDVTADISVAAIGVGGGVGVGIGGSAGDGGTGDTVTSTLTGNVVTLGDTSPGVIVQSKGGGGGNGGVNVTGTVALAGLEGGGGVSVGLGGSGGDGRSASDVTSRVTGDISTAGSTSGGLLVQSSAGGGGNGAVNVAGTLTMSGEVSGGISVGIGGSGGDGSNSGVVQSRLTGDVTTAGDTSPGVIVQSKAGGGGNGGVNVSAAANLSGTVGGGISVGVGGSGGGGGTSDEVTGRVTGNVTTSGDTSPGIAIQSLGGGGGNGGVNVTAAISLASQGSGAVGVGVGGTGGDGGDGAATTGVVTGDTSTSGANSPGITIQSQGGGGGNGGVNVTAALSLSTEGSGAVGVGVGGMGGGSGDGAAVDATVTGDVSTEGDTSTGITVQSLGGGGGNGAVSVGAALSLSSQSSGAIGVGVGGFGGDGGDASTVTSNLIGGVTTTGDISPGVIVQSKAGGGGNGGVTVDGAISVGGQGSGAFGIGVGGFGGEGGNSSSVTASYDGITSTSGDYSGGVTAQSLGGGGGNGATVVSSAISIGNNFSGAIGVGVGGFGGSGGDSGTVDHDVSGYVRTTGDRSVGVMTQSSAGDGGNGGVDVTTTLSLSRNTSGSIGVGIGGFGSDGGDSDDVTSDFTGGVLTRGYRSGGIVTQSVGGSGGTGGTNVTSALNLTMKDGGSVGVGIGGFGGGGGDAGTVDATVATPEVSPSFITRGDASIGVLAQSSAGGGGVGGVDVATSVSVTGESGGAIGFGLGGFGGDGGDAGDVSLEVTGDVTTRGDDSHGIFAQSSAGSGGIGGVNVSSSLSFTKPSSSDTILSVSVGVGGFGGGGGTASDVDLSFGGTVTSVPTTTEDGETIVDTSAAASGIIAQSLGGGGGHGGVDVASGISISTVPGNASPEGSSYAAVVGVGGFGGTGGDAGDVSVNVKNGSEIYAYGDGQSGIMAQSVGGGGGHGGLNVSTGIVSDTTLVVGVGGFGGNSGAGGDVSVRSRADIQVLSNPDQYDVPDEETTEDELKSLVGTVTFNTIDEDIVEQKASAYGLTQLLVDLGLFDEDTVEVDGSAGVFAQSVGGAGGSGGLDVATGVEITRTSKIPGITFGIGGFGGDANVAGEVDVDHAGDIEVTGHWKHGIQAQSVGGGGGHGGLNVTADLVYSSSVSSNGYSDLSIVGGVGGNGGDGADAGDVEVISDGDISTTGYHGRGVFAQSVGGSGGTGGVNFTGMGTVNSSPIEFGVGGSGSGGGVAGAVSVTRGSAESAAGTITTNGTGAHGIEAASIGGGGGSAGVNAVIGISAEKNEGSSAGTSSERQSPTNTGVDADVITNYNRVLDEFEGRTTGDSTQTSAGSYAAIVTVGGNGADGGDGDDVNVTHYGDIVTLGTTSYGAFAQSLGGGGGSGAFNFGLMKQIGSANEQSTLGFSLGIGGGGGEGATSGDVTLDNTGMVSTAGDDSHGLFAQALGGGGGNAGYNSISNSAEGGQFSLIIGRSGGTGGEAGEVTLSSDGEVSTAGDRSHGLFAQSIANGGGNSSTTNVRLAAPASATGDTQGASFNLQVGLDGGKGGEAGDVDIDATGSVATAGDDSYGIFAQSVGGSGGTGGGAASSATSSLSMQIAIGGTGGEGGTSGTVDVDSSAAITTEGDRAVGIVAQSLGGGGGIGGFAKSGISTLNTLIGAATNKNFGTIISIGVGGEGGEGNTADTVDVTSTGDIDTQGTSSHGIFAQGVGGGGGLSGVAENQLVSLRGSIGNSYNMSIGGRGGDGEAGSSVTVKNQATIVTSGSAAAGIFVQSVGGGGGAADHTRNIVLGSQSAGSSANALLIGGGGGTGGAGADATVVNNSDGIIATSGDQGHGIFVQSVGSGGGSGGSTESAALTSSQSGASQQTNIVIGIGGSGGEGGSGGTATATNRGSIATSGDDAHGIIAQSLGGGGGAGGMTLLGSAILKTGTSADPSIQFALGGSGGEGEAGGDVVVSNSGTIEVTGDSSYGIHAQSVGGGGGNGGLSVAFSGNNIKGRVSGTSYTQIALGGFSGDGADGGDVDVTHTGSITASGDNAYGIFAQSVGGGGGNVGYSVSSPVVTVGDYVFRQVLGAGDGSEGGVGDVTVTGTGDIITGGTNSQAIFTQTISGGGGSIDTFTDFTGISDTTSDDDLVASIVLEPELTTATYTADDVPSAPDMPLVDGKIQLGSDSSDGNKGGSVDLTHEGDLETQGDYSVGLQSQNIGGGGGQSFSDYKVNRNAPVDIELTLGATDSDSSGGGDIAIDQDGNIATGGLMSSGASVQSVGGGGGRLTANIVATKRNGVEDEARDASAQLILGTDPGLRNKGGDVDLDFSGDISTTGEDSPGVIVQSIGAGGGEAYITGFNDLKVRLGAKNGSTGSGGDIDFVNTGAVVTTGTRADGIVVQSIGGGGGYVRTDLDEDDVDLRLRSGNSGSGGDVALDQNGSVVVAGKDAIGILAQSLGGGGGAVDGLFRGTSGGNGSGGDVTISGNGNVLAYGRSGVGVMAQSLGASGAGRVHLDLNGVIRGGRGSEARAIVLDGGNSNRIELGDESFVYAANNIALRANTGNDVVRSQGTIVGDIRLGGGENLLRNRGKGELVTQDVVRLGSNGVLRNSGLLVPGGAVIEPSGETLSRANLVVTQNVAQTTNLKGSLEMTESSRFEVDAAFRVSGAAGDGGDLIDATGSATVDGDIVPSLLTFERVLPLTIIETGGAAADNGAVVQDTATVDFSIGLGSIQLIADPDFSLPGMTANERAVGDYMTDILTGDGSEELGELFAAIGNMTEADEVIETMSHFTTEGFGANRVSTLFSGLTFATAISECDRRRPVGVELPYGDCAWLTTEGTRFNQDAYDDFQSLEANSFLIMGGMERVVDDLWTVGFGGAWERVDVSSGSAFSSDSDRGHLGGLVKRQYGRMTVGGTLSASFGEFANKREPRIDLFLPNGDEVEIGEARSDQDVFQTNIGLDAEYRYDDPLDRFFLVPSIGVDATYIRSGSFDESGDGDLGYEVESADDWVFSVTPAVEVGALFENGDGSSFQPYLRGGLTVLSKDGFDTSAAFLGAAAADGDFTNETGFDKLYGRLDFGIDFLAAGKRTRVALGYSGAYSENARFHGVSAQLSYRF